MTARALALLLVLAGCGDDESALERARLGIHAADTAGRSADVACEELPLLQGSRRYTTHVIDDRLVIEVVAEPAEVTVRFEDTEGKPLPGTTRTLPRGLLLNGGDPELVGVTLEGKIYMVTLNMGCSP